MSADETREALAAVLAEHAGYRVTAGWTGSPDPANPRNIAKACSCGHRVSEWPWLHDDTAGQSAAHRTHVVDALLASGLIPEGTTTEEWGLRFPSGYALDNDANGWRGYNAENYARQRAQEEGAVPVRRTRTTYPDRVTDWEEVQ